MRPQQQNRRMRGRNNSGGGNNNNNNNNRKGPNPLTRNYESNGPDVNIRGSAQQIAEKYAHLPATRIAPATGSWRRTICSTPNTTIASSPPRRRSCHPEHADTIATIPTTTWMRIPTSSSRAGQRMRAGNVSRARQPDWQCRSAPAGELRWRRPQQMNLGAGPQPVIEGPPAEVALNTEHPATTAPRQERHVTGSAQSMAQNRRRRRPPRRGAGPRRGERSRPERQRRGAGPGEAVAQRSARGARRACRR